MTARSPLELPETRPELMALHAVARGHRAAAVLGSDAYRAACEAVSYTHLTLPTIYSV